MSTSCGAVGALPIGVCIARYVRCSITVAPQASSKAAVYGISHELFPSVGSTTSKGFDAPGLNLHARLVYRSLATASHCKPNQEYKYTHKIIVYAML